MLNSPWHSQCFQFHHLYIQYKLRFILWCASARVIIVTAFSSRHLYWKTSHKGDDQGNEYKLILCRQSDLGCLLGTCACRRFPFTAWPRDPKQCPGWNVRAARSLLPPTAGEGLCPVRGGEIQSAVPSTTSFHVQTKVREAQCRIPAEDCLSVFCFSDSVLDVLL